MIKDLINQLQALPQDYIVKLPAKTMFDLDKNFKDNKQVTVKQITLPLKEITIQHEKKTIHLQFDTESLLEYELNAMEKNINVNKEIPNDKG